MKKVSMNRDRAKGMLWGLVVGDCLGSPIQFTNKDGHRWITEMEPCDRFGGLPPGYWTDDSALAMCIMESYARKGRYVRADIARNFMRWYCEGFCSSLDGQAFDIGSATALACEAIHDEGSLVNGTEDSQGNGSIMRFAPSYLLAQREDDPARTMHEISDITHASQAVRDICDELSAVLDSHMAGRRTDRGPGREMARIDVPNSGWCVDTLEAALWAFNTTKTFADGMIAAVNLGGDADTIGAVYGQIAGTFYGYRAIPEKWLAEVHARKKVDRLIERFLDAVASKATR